MATIDKGIETKGVNSEKIKRALEGKVRLKKKVLGIFADNIEPGLILDDGALYTKTIKGLIRYVDTTNRQVFFKQNLPATSNSSAFVSGILHSRYINQFKNWHNKFISKGPGKYLRLFGIKCKITVSGYASIEGDVTFNKQLSGRRVDSFIKWYQNYYKDFDKLYTTPITRMFGSEKATKNNEKKDRKVTVRITLDQVLPEISLVISHGSLIIFMNNNKIFAMGYTYRLFKEGPSKKMDEDFNKFSEELGKYPTEMKHYLKKFIIEVSGKINEDNYIDKVKYKVFKLCVTRIISIIEAG